jgi:7-carboxy-7-deazaguanine synthase
MHLAQTSVIPIAPIAPDSYRDGGTKLPVMEAFYTIQGEGFHQGRAAYFIRLAGCTVNCFWCDVKESWDADKHPQISIDNIVQKACEEPARLAVITGGEPLMYNLDELTDQLQSKGFETNIETSGSFPLSGSWNWICVSPKKFKPPTAEALNSANELKVVIYNKNDFAWAETHAKQVNENCKLYLQPEWERTPVITPLIIDYIKQNPKWELSLQIHKYINVP